MSIDEEIETESIDWDNAVWLSEQPRGSQRIQVVGAKAYVFDYEVGKIVHEGQTFLWTQYKLVDVRPAPPWRPGDPVIFDDASRKSAFDFAAKKEKT